jgi:hypothetical protein
VGLKSNKSSRKSREGDKEESTGVGGRAKAVTRAEA